MPREIRARGTFYRTRYRDSNPRAMAARYFPGLSSSGDRSPPQMLEQHERCFITDLSGAILHGVPAVAWLSRSGGYPRHVQAAWSPARYPRIRCARGWPMWNCARIARIEGTRSAASCSANRRAARSCKGST